MRSHVLKLLLTATILLTAEVEAGDYLSTGDIAAVSAGSVSLFALGQWANNVDSTKKPLIRGPLPLESSLQRFLGGTCTLGQRNFLDSRAGAAYTTATTALLLTIANISWYEKDLENDAFQDMFLFAAGLAATKGATDLAKGLTARPRPLPYLEPKLAAQRQVSDYSFDHHSFFSGHASSAFFAMTYLNKRLRAIMRRELHTDEYRDWRWAPPAVLFSWASFVGWSRIHAYQHYLSDVLVGALAGYLMAELFYSFGENNSEEVSNANAQQMLLRVTLSF